MVEDLKQKGKHRNEKSMAYSTGRRSRSPYRSK